MTRLIILSALAKIFSDMFPNAYSDHNGRSKYTVDNVRRQYASYRVVYSYASSHLFIS